MARASGKPSGMGSDSAASVMFGAGAHMPVLNGSRPSDANRMAHSPGMRAAGAALSQAMGSRASQEFNGDRLQKKPAQSRYAAYDSYLSAIEDHTFSRLHANLKRAESKAEREHRMMDGAAGFSTEQRCERAERRAQSPGRRRSGSPAPGFDPNHSVASLLQGGADAPSHRAPSPRNRRSASPVPHLRSTGRDSPILGADSARDTSRSGCSEGGPGWSPRRASSPRRERAPSPRRERAASPRRERAA